MHKFVVMGRAFETLEEAQAFAQRFAVREERTYGCPPVYDYVDEVDEVDEEETVVMKEKSAS